MRTVRRRALSPVIAEVLLIAIVLIEAIAIGGFIFGLFGNFTHTAEVSAGVSISAQNGIVGNVTLLNTGDSNTQATGISLIYSGQTCQVTQTSPGLPVTVSAGATAVVIKITAADCPNATTGTDFSGEVQLANGASLPFEGSFQ